MNLKLALVIVALLGAAAAKTKWFELENYSFEDYNREFHKTHDNEQEKAFRRDIFEQNLQKIKLHNQDTTKTWKEGVNRFTDRTYEEFSRVNGLDKAALYNSKFMDSKRNAPQYAFTDKYQKELPIAVDWRDSGIISPVKDQGECGSCWTFGTTETIEAYWAQLTGNLEDLSEQQILDCVPNPDECGGTGGCGGGTPEIAMAGLQKLGGQASEWVYPYTSWSGSNETCKTLNPTVNIYNYTVLPSNLYGPIIAHLAWNGPLIVNVEASTWQFYESGVFDGCNKTNPDIDHVVQLVGYGVDKVAGNYWLVRNSWSPLWGEHGYIRLKRHEIKTPCGEDIKPMDGTGCKGGPAEVKVCGTCGILFDVSYPYVTNAQ